MQTGLYVALSSMIAAERRLATIADNVANINTVGFKEVGVRFAELIDGKHGDDTSFVTPGKTTLSSSQGPIEQTNNPLDFAIQGEGWFQVVTPAGQALTRDGRFELTADGTLVTLDGFQVLDQGGAPVQVNPVAGPVRVDGAGILHQGSGVVGSIGVFDYGKVDELMRYGALSILPAGEATAAADRTDFSVVQGFVEGSNVNAVAQLTRMISVQRNFEQMASLVTASEDSLGEAIRLLGGK